MLFCFLTLSLLICGLNYASLANWLPHILVNFTKYVHFAMMCNNASECFIYFLLFKTHLRRSSLLLLWFFLPFVIEGVAGCVPAARLPG